MVQKCAILVVISFDPVVKRLNKKYVRFEFTRFWLNPISTIWVFRGVSEGFLFPQKLTREPLKWQKVAANVHRKNRALRVSGLHEFLCKFFKNVWLRRKRKMWNRNYSLFLKFLFNNLAITRFSYGHFRTCSSHNNIDRPN